MTNTNRACMLAAAALLGLWPGSVPVNAAAQEAPPAEQADAPPAPARHPIAQCLFDNISGLRAAHGVPAVTEHPVLSYLAQGHSDAMAAQSSLHHSSADIFALLPPGWRSFGEDVVAGTSCEQMWTALGTSQPHMDIIVRPDFNSVGTAVAAGGDGWTYATLMFLDAPSPIPRPAPLVPQQPASPAPSPPSPPPPPPSPPPPGAPPAAPLPPIVAEPPTITLDGSDAPGGSLPSLIAPESTSPDGDAGRSSRRRTVGRSALAVDEARPPGSGEAIGGVLFSLEEKDEIAFDLEYEPVTAAQESTPVVHFSLEGP